MAADLANLPPMIREFVRLVGHAKTMRLVADFGGTRLRMTDSEDHPDHQALIESIGAKATKALTAAFKAEGEVYVAKCDRALRDDRNRRIIQRYDELLKGGYSSPAAAQVLAREHRLSYRTIETVVNTQSPDQSALATQLSLI